MSGGLAELAPGGPGLAPHRHAQPEIDDFVGGEGLLTVDGVETLLRAGEAAYIPGDAEHSLRNAGRETLRVFDVFPPTGFPTWSIGSPPTPQPDERPPCQALPFAAPTPTAWRR